MYYNLSSALRFDPATIDKMRVYQTVVYTRRMKKAGLFGDKNTTASGVKKGTPQDFNKLFGNATQ